MKNLSQHERILRAVAAVALIGTPFLVQGPVEGLAWLPLVGVYPALTAWLGWDPVKGLFQRRPATLRRGEAANEPHYEKEHERRRAA